MKHIAVSLLLSVPWLQSPALAQAPVPAAIAAPKPAEPSVAAVFETALRAHPFADQQDFADARRGFIATVPDAQDPQRYGFLASETPPPTVHPSLWRLARLNAIHGLFEAAPGVYQVRGFALANMTIVEGARGIIVVDPLGSTGAARLGLDLYFAHRPKKPVTAVIYTHSHGDHYPGAGGVATPEDVAAGRTEVIAPAGFMEAVVAEAVIAGNAMGRRAAFQFGNPLPRGATGNVDAGLGKIDSAGTPGRGVLRPTVSIAQPIEERTVDGVRFVFQLTPQSEAPAELHFFLPDLHVLDLAENATHTMHNLLPLRGTEVRDAKAWSAYLGEALDRFGAQTEVLIAQHHWPVWGRDRVAGALARQRDLYKYLHDQSVRLMNHGHTPAEIAEALTLPPSLVADWATHGFYGTLSHNAKAVYQKYIGWYDGNPAHLNPLPPADGAKKYVEYMGGGAAVVARAREDFRTGQYRWVAEVMNQVVFADPGNADARALGADAFEQMGYAAESATWRNAYLLAAQELRQGPPARREATLQADTLRIMPLPALFDVLGTFLNGPRAVGRRAVINWRMTDSGEQLVSTLDNGALTALAGRQSPAAQATVAITRAAFEAVVARRQTLADAVASGAAIVSGDASAPTALFDLMDRFEASFPIMEPRR
jgi:alkyl sulfatase BDS1-like metallo-beta-lactamase superfamily hydrolase